MTVKQYLNQLRGLDNRINAKAGEIERFRNIATNVSAALEIPVQQSRNTGKMAGLIAKIADTENELTAEIDAFIHLKKQISGEIDQMENNTYAALLSERYLNNQTWESVGEKLGYETRTVHVLHGRALKEFEKLFTKFHGFSS